MSDHWHDGYDPPIDDKTVRTIAFDGTERLMRHIKKPRYSRGWYTLGGERIAMEPVFWQPVPEANE